MVTKADVFAVQASIAQCTPGPAVRNMPVLPSGEWELVFEVKAPSNAAVQETVEHAVIGLTQPARAPATDALTHIDEHRFVREEVKLRTV